MRCIQKNIVHKNFTWGSDVILSNNKTTVTALINGADWFGNAAPSYFSVNDTYILREGEEVGLFWGYDFAGVYQGGDIPEGTAVIPASKDGDGNPIPGEPLFYEVVDEDGNVDGAGSDNFFKYSSRSPLVTLPSFPVPLT